MPAKPMLVKRYGRSRLYDTEHARYVSIDDLRGWRDRGVAFIVIDAESLADVTLVVLA